MNRTLVLRSFAASVGVRSSSMGSAPLAGGVATSRTVRCASATGMDSTGMASSAARASAVGTGPLLPDALDRRCRHDPEVEGWELLARQFLRRDPVANRGMRDREPERCLAHADPDRPCHASHEKQKAPLPTLEAEPRWSAPPP